MSDAWVEVGELKKRLTTFFNHHKPELNRFGSTVNQTFEAYVIAQVIGWYKDRGWTVFIQNPIDAITKSPVFRLKFSTRGRPGSYSYALCISSDGKEAVQIRHQLRVATRWYKEGQIPKANICLDVAVIRDVPINHLSSSDHVPNKELVSFGEAKHMSAFAELIASFLGVVHELQPQRLKRFRLRRAPPAKHVPPFLYVSGKMWSTAEGLYVTVQKRKYDIDIWTARTAMSSTLTLPTKKR